jgi:hypothetical protein
MGVFFCVDGLCAKSTLHEAHRRVSQVFIKPTNTTKCLEYNRHIYIYISTTSMSQVFDTAHKAVWYLWCKYLKIVKTAF